MRRLISVDIQRIKDKQSVATAKAIFLSQHSRKENIHIIIMARVLNEFSEINPGKAYRAYSDIKRSTFGRSQ
jgi:hypothetical protein